MIRQIAALVFIFICTTIAWMILGATLSARTNSSNEQLQGRVASTWGTPQEQSPPTATYRVTEFRDVPKWENGKSVVRTEKIENQIPVKLTASRIQVDFHLDQHIVGNLLLLQRGDGLAKFLCLLLDLLQRGLVGLLSLRAITPSAMTALKPRLCVFVSNSLPKKRSTTASPCW